MAQVTLQLLEGLERGLIFRKLNTPVTIGREDENSVRLNDERVSRFHAKIQEDGGKLILTDLESTNGTRINGRRMPSGRLRPGDELALADVCYRLVESAGEGPAGGQRGRSPGPKGPTPS